MGTKLAETKLGPETELNAEFVDGKIKLSARYDGQGLDAELSVYVDPSYVFDALAAKIPGSTDDALFALLKGAFLK